MRTQSISAIAGTAKARRIQAFADILKDSKLPVTQDEFDQIIFDAVARDRTMTRESIAAWARKTYTIVEEKHEQ